MEPVKYIHTEEVHNLKAPAKVVPIIVDMFKPKSVLDVGCGTGTWLKCFNDLGVKDIMGIDGDYVDKPLLNQNITSAQFIGTDLTKAFDLGRKFDLVISLEVAEHLPPEAADNFIHTLTQHGETIIFSAAIPYQGGQNHLNERWKKFWVEIFLKYKYGVFDLLRPLIWDDQDVDWWYRQNMLVFSKLDLTNLEPTQRSVLETVHPALYQQHVEYIIYLQQYVKELEEKLSHN